MSRLLAIFLALVIATTGIVVAPSPAAAQDTIYRPWLRNLLAPTRRILRLERREYIPETRRQDIPGARPKVRARTKAGSSKSRSASTSVREAPEAPIVEKLPDAKVVLVVGDFLGSGLAEGLTTVFAENPRVRVVDRSKGSSGFVRDDFFDWPGEITGMIAEEKPAAIVVMLGSNDRQQMRVGQERETLRTDAWISEYGRRTVSFGKSISDQKTPFIWIGLPAFKSSKMTSDMLAFNDIYRTAAESAGAEFIDIWDGFVDENGAFATMGPDINGQPVRLRASDGINLTKAGKRKLAFYAEKPLNKILGEAGTPGIAAVAPLPALSPDAKAAPVNRTVPISLNDPELDGGSELLGQTPSSRNAPSPEKRAVSEADPGRADDFSRRRKPPAPATAGAPAPLETTTAIRR